MKNYEFLVIWNSPKKSSVPLTFYRQAETRELQKMVKMIKTHAHAFNEVIAYVEEQRGASRCISMTYIYHLL